MTEIQTRFCDETDAVIIILYAFGLRSSPDSLTCFVFDIRFFLDSLKGYVVPLRAAIGSQSKSSSPPVQYASRREGSVGARVPLGSDSGDADLHSFEMVYQTLHQGKGRG